MSNDLPDELRTLIETHIDAYNTKNHERFISVFDDAAIIIDGVAPYRWLSPNAPAKWLADGVKWYKENDVSHTELSYELSFWMMVGSYAYAVVSGVYHVTIKGQTHGRTGLLTYTFSKGEHGWKIGAQAWARTS